MTTRGCIDSDFETIADFLIRAAQFTGSVRREHGKPLRDPARCTQNKRDILELRSRVEAFGQLRWKITAACERFAAYLGWFKQI